MALNWNILNTSRYADLRFDLIKNMEGSNIFPYLDTDMIPTVGIGFNLRVHSEIILEAILGFTPPSNLIVDIKAAVDAVYADNTALKNALNAIMSNWHVANNNIPDIFAFSSDSQVRIVFDALVTTYEDKVDNWLAGIPPSEERAVLFSLAFNTTDGEDTTLLGPNLKAAIENGNRAEAWYEIRYQSNGDALPGIANRRYAESEKFGLYDDPEVISLNEAINVLQMYTKHKPTILGYETNYSVPSNHNGVAGIQGIRDELAPAIQLVADYLGISDGVDIDNFDIMIDYLPEGSGDDVGTEYLQGDSGKNIMLGEVGDDTLEAGADTDILIGGIGNDLLDGGSGFDTYIFRDGYGIDTIRDSDHDGIIQWGAATGTLISLTGEAQYEAGSGDTWILTVNGQTFWLEAVNGDLHITKSGGSGGDEIIIQDFTEAGTLFHENNFGSLTLKTPEDAHSGIGGIGNIVYDNVIKGSEGSDQLNSHSPKESLHDDTIDGAGSLIFYGGTGSDSITGGNEHNLVYAGAGNDTIIGGLTGHNIIYGGAGNDSMRGGAENDFLSGGDGNDYIQGSFSGANTLFGGSGDDTLIGGESSNGTTMYGGAGNDVLSGSEYSGDFFVYNIGDGHDTITENGGNNDTLQFGSGITFEDMAFSRDNLDVLIELENGSVRIRDYFNDADPREIETIVFDGGILVAADIEALVNHGETVTGTEGNDVLVGTAFDDEMLGDDGNDVLEGQSGDDSLLGGFGNDTLYGDDGADMLYGNEGADVIYGGAGDDTLYGGSGHDILNGGAGADVLNGESDTATVSYESDTVGIHIDLGDSGSQSGGEAEGDVLINIRKVIGGSGDDWIKGTEGNHTLIGGAGNDTLDGGNQADLLTGGNGSDIFHFSSWVESALPNDSDRITDFEDGIDLIDLMGLGFTHFTSNSTTIVGELRAEYSNGQTYILSDQEDFGFRINGNHTASLTDADFIF